MIGNGRAEIKKYICDRSEFMDLLLYISLAGGRSLKYIKHERETLVIYLLMTDIQTVIY